LEKKRPQSETCPQLKKKRILFSKRVASKTSNMPCNNCNSMPFDHKSDLTIFKIWRRPQRKTTSMEDDHFGKQPQCKRKSIEDDIIGRQP
jgi:hypothetical protein